MSICSSPLLIYFTTPRASLTHPIYYDGGILTIGDNNPYLFKYNKQTGELIEKVWRWRGTERGKEKDIV